MERRWWHDKTAYQIWPKSFRDSDGDGIGDLRGVIEELGYLQDLGIDLIWLSPVYRSPLADQGYDISDYYDIDPRFGTMADMEELIREAKSRGIGILMDLVVNHCSDEHEWFRRACQAPDGPYGRYFYIEDHRPGDPLPCNWRSYFGGPVWSELPGHPDKIYLHLFHRKQPDLNWEHPEVRQEIYRMIRWWLDKGVAGFRIDAIINIKKLLPFRDFPADRADGLCSVDEMLSRADGVLDFLDEMAAATFHAYDAFTVGEVFNEKPGELGRFIGDHGCFSTMFDFAPSLLSQDPRGWTEAPRLGPDDFKAACFASQRKAEGVGLLCNIIENHDQPRGVSRYLPEGERSDAAKKMLGGLSFLLKGVPFLYQGQEIGMEDRHWESIDEIDDVASKDAYRVALDAGHTPEEAMEAVRRLSRDNARTPVQWDASPNAGFTTGTPWIPVNENHTRINVAAQKGVPGSVWETYRALIALRKDPAYRETIVYGRTEPYLEEQRGLMAYFRRGEGQDLLVIGNCQAEPRDVPLPGPVVRSLLPDPLDLEEGVLHAVPWQFAVLEMAAEG